MNLKMYLATLSFFVPIFGMHRLTVNELTEKIKQCTDLDHENHFDLVPKMNKSTARDLCDLKNLIENNPLVFNCIKKNNNHYQDFVNNNETLYTMEKEFLIKTTVCYAIFFIAALFGTCWFLSDSIEKKDINTDLLLKACIMGIITFILQRIAIPASHEYQIRTQLQEIFNA